MTVTVTAGGYIYEGWKDVQISAHVEHMARSFALRVTDQWPGSGGVVERLRPGDEIVVAYAGEPLVTGYIDRTPMRYDGRSVSEYTIAGRSRTADLIDCSAMAKPGQWRNAHVSRIVRDLVQPYAVQLQALADSSAPIKQFKLDRGETAQEAIDRAIGQRALLATDNGAGQLVLTRAGTGASGDAIELGENVLAAETERSFESRHSTYTAFGQRAGTDNDFGEPTVVPTGSATDGEVQRYRSLLISMSGQITPEIARERAAWEAVYRRARSYEATYTVQGWKQLSGGLWQPNTLVHVRDAVLGYDAQMIIAGIEYLLDDDEGERVRLQVLPPSAFERRPDVPTASTKPGSGVPFEAGATVVTF